MIRIINETGLSKDTKVIDTETGNVIKGIKRVEILPIDHVPHIIQAKLTFNCVALDGKVEEIEK